ncbi:hypothetical protein [Caldimonas tepidiphila]|uniref:hypothetical protein n=1 Tax=Caldimonas tepidiphila TaxID=2315841 RepID=UPI000E5B6995|nr:hypothetical protein [Caldimonas tepidiphila]
MTTIYAKTAKGQQEVEQRSAGLSLRARRLLILLDGKRARREVAALVSDSDFEQTLAQLVEQGFAQPLAPPPATLPAPPQAAEPIAPASGPVASDAPHEDPKRVEMARNFMLNSLMALYGPHEKLSLKTSIQQCRRQQELRELYEDWFRAVSATRAGKLRAEELRDKLLAVL